METADFRMLYSDAFTSRQDTEANFGPSAVMNRLLALQINVTPALVMSGSQVGVSSAGVSVGVVGSGVVLTASTTFQLASSLYKADSCCFAIRNLPPACLK